MANKETQCSRTSSWASPQTGPSVRRNLIDCISWPLPSNGCNSLLVIKPATPMKYPPMSNNLNLTRAQCIINWLHANSTQKMSHGEGMKEWDVLIAAKFNWKRASLQEASIHMKLYCWCPRFLRPSSWLTSPRPGQHVISDPTLIKGPRTFKKPLGAAPWCSFLKSDGVWIVIVFRLLFLSCAGHMGIPTSAMWVYFSSFEGIVINLGWTVLSVHAAMRTFLTFPIELDTLSWAPSVL